MSADQVELTPNWPGVPAGKVKRIDPDALVRAADQLVEEVRNLADTTRAGTPGYLTQRTKVTDELAPTWHTAMEVTGAFNTASELVVSYYQQLVTQLTNAAATLRASAAKHASTDQSNGRSFAQPPTGTDASGSDKI